MARKRISTSGPVPTITYRMKGRTMADVYQIITDRIISQLESGTVPWHKPWNVGTHGGPQNLVSKKEYRGVNVFLLSCMPYSLPYMGVV